MNSFGYFNKYHIFNFNEARRATGSIYDIRSWYYTALCV